MNIAALLISAAGLIVMTVLVAWQIFGDGPHRLVSIHNVGAMHAVHVHIDEAGDDVMIAEVEMQRTAVGRPVSGDDVDDAVGVDDDGAGADDPVREYEIGAEVREVEGNRYVQPIEK